MLSIALSYYYVFLIITSFNQGVCIQLGKSNWILHWSNCTSHFHNLGTVYCYTVLQGAPKGHSHIPVYTR